MRGNEYFYLRAFAAVMENGSFSRAAEQLRLSPSVLSQVIRSLDRRLNARLLNRTTHSLSATDEGAQLFARFKPALTEIETAAAAVGSLGGSLKGTLRLHVPRLAARIFPEPLLDSSGSAIPASFWMPPSTIRS